MKLKKALAALLLAILLMNLCSFDLAESETVAPDFTVTDTDGNKIKLSDLLAGKPLIFNIWASWCPPCVGELPHFEQAAEEYADRVTFMMINLTDGYQETLSLAKSFLLSNGYTFPAYFDTEGEASDLYLGQYIPMTWFINADGTILGYIEGAMDRDTLYQCIDMLLEG